MESWITTGKSRRSKMSQSSKNVDGDEDWSRIFELSRIATFRYKLIDKWQRKTDADEVPEGYNTAKETQSDAGAQADGGDRELLDDFEFYQQLVKEFFETIDPATSEWMNMIFKQFVRVE